MRVTAAHLSDRIFQIQSPADFKALAIEVFRFQYRNIATYREFCDHLNVKPQEVDSLQKIPFLPIELFKRRSIKTTQESQMVFYSSGTTGTHPSRHEVVDLSIYEKSFFRGFERSYGSPTDWAILALLPSYLEREGSSLIYMAQALIDATNNKASGFYLHDHKSLKKQLQLLEAKQQKTLLLGVSYALLDLIQDESFALKHTIVMETGGMKGRRKEMIKSELHQILMDGFSVDRIHSEYGMTELLSQAYSSGGGKYTCPPWMQVLTRDPEDPLCFLEGRSGGINVIDLANINSCAFIATQDLGKRFPDGSFEILGRFDHSDVRGCNLMVF